MHFLTILLSCLLALFGVDKRPSTTSITRVVENGTELLFSKTTQVEGQTVFECFSSASGGCHYRIWEENCPADARDASGDQACRRHELDRFELAVGRRHHVQGLPRGFRHCVTTATEASCAS